MSAAFTPGPWHVTQTVHAGKKNIFGMSPTAAFHVGTLTSGSKSKLDVFDANARLIAAAPELYEALLFVSRNSGKLSHMDWQMVESTLAKARGETA